MCELYASQPQSLYDTTKRSLRIQGVVTSLALENQMWHLLEQLAQQQQCSVAEFISVLYQEIIERHGEVKNLSSMLRVTCLTYVMNNKVS